MNITITSLNLQGFDYWDTRAPHILNYLSETNPEIVCFQEVVYLPQVSPLTPVDHLNTTLGYPYQVTDITRLQKGIEYHTYREGLSTISKLPIAKTETLILKQSEGDEHNRIIQLIDVRAADGTLVKIANIHFSITDFVDYATPHLEETLEILKSRNEKRIIIGDFNLTYLEESKELWGNEYHSTCDTPYVTYPDMNKRVDYALVPNEYTVDSIKVSPDGLSDHRALTITVSLPTETI